MSFINAHHVMNVCSRQMVGSSRRVVTARGCVIEQDVVTAVKVPGVSGIDAQPDSRTPRLSLDRRGVFVSGAGHEASATSQHVVQLFRSTLLNRCTHLEKPS